MGVFENAQEFNMLPVVAIVGRPNVGKSTLFNLLTRTRDALVTDMPGVTRDRQYGEGVIGKRPYLVIDTGGIALADDPEMAERTDQQVAQAIDEADILLFLVDAKSGLTVADLQIATQLRHYRDKTVLVVNKVDHEDTSVAVSEFYQMGLANPIAISATRGRGVKALMANLLADLPEKADEEIEAAQSGIHIAVVGRPNVGKSTLINRILGEERVIVLDRPGTTRDSIFIPFIHREQHYTLIDTAGVRRRSKIKHAIEKFSIIKTIQAMQQAHVVIMVMDAQEGVTDQDLRLLGMIINLGKPVVITMNKWDGLDEQIRLQIKEKLDRRLQFAKFARRYYISALHGSGVGKLYYAINEAYAAANQTLSTPELTRVLNQALADHMPPLVKGRRIRLRFAHLGGHHPLTIIIHGKQTEALPNAYRRYLINYFRQAFNLTGVPIRIHFKSDANPYVEL